MYFQISLGLEPSPATNGAVFHYWCFRFLYLTRQIETSSTSTIRWWWSLRERKGRGRGRGERGRRRRERWDYTLVSNSERSLTSLACGNWGNALAGERCATPPMGGDGLLKLLRGGLSNWFNRPRLGSGTGGMTGSCGDCRIISASHTPYCTWLSIIRLWIK